MKPNVSGVIGSIVVPGAIVDIYGNIRSGVNVITDPTEIEKLDTLIDNSETTIYGGKNK